MKLVVGRAGSTPASASLRLRPILMGHMISWHQMSSCDAPSGRTFGVGPITAHCRSVLAVPSKVQCSVTVHLRSRSHVELRHEPEVQTFGSLVFVRLQIFLLLIRRHGIPFLSPGLVPVIVIPLREQIEQEVTSSDACQLHISSAVKWLVILTIHIGGDYKPQLRGYPVQCRRHSSRTDSVRVATAPRGLHGMRMRMCNQNDRDGVADPRVGVIWQLAQRQHTRKHPELAECSHQCSLTPALEKIGKD